MTPVWKRLFNFLGLSIKCGAWILVGIMIANTIWYHLSRVRHSLHYNFTAFAAVCYLVALVIVPLYAIFYIRRDKGWALVPAALMALCIIEFIRYYD